MKKLVLLIALLVGNLMLTFAQDDIVLYITDCPETQHLCIEDNQRVIVYAQEGCDGFRWKINEEQIIWNESPLIIDSQYGNSIRIYYGPACDGFSHSFWVYYHESMVPTSFTHDVWKRQGTIETLEAVGNDSIEWPFQYTYLWSTGSTERTIDVTESGTYSVEITDWCGTATRTFIVRDNVELYRATCDLRTNLNQVTWQTTPEQAEYVSAVNVYRNTYQLVATVPYLDGSFTDNIGSEATQWQYHLVAVGNDGDECPLPSYWKRTIHLDHVQGTGGGEILQWTPYEEESPAKNTVIYYSIYDVVDGEPNHVMDVGNFTNVYAYDPNDFNGYGTVAAVFAAKGERDLEDMAFSNMTADILDVGESMQEAFKVYPNPTNGTFTVAGASTLTVFNTLGQAVATSHSANGTHTFTLPSGIYFLKSEEGTVLKVVVE